MMIPSEYQLRQEIVHDYILGVTAQAAVSSLRSVFYAWLDRKNIAR